MAAGDSGPGRLRKSFRNSSSSLRRGRKVAIPLLILIFLSTPISIPLWGDTVVLKNGHGYRNVRTHLGKKNLRIEFSNGKVLLFPKEQLKKLTPSPVRWPRKRNEQRNDSRANGRAPRESRSPKTGRNGRRQNRTEPSAGDKSKGPDRSSPDHSDETAGRKGTGQSKPIVRPPPGSTFNNGGQNTDYEPKTFFPRLNSPARSRGFYFLMGLIPGWSGHYLQDRFVVGHTFAVSELVILFASTHWREPVPLIKDPIYLMIGLTHFSPMFSTGAITPELLLWLSYGQNTVRNPNTGGNGYMPLKDYKQMRRGAGAALLLVLLGDGFSSALLYGRNGVERKPRTARFRPSLELDQTGRETRARAAIQFYL